MKSLPDNWRDFARLCEIKSGAKILKFDPYDYQLKLIEHIEKHISTLILKTRQLGITETIANWFLFHACKNPAYLAAVFSKNGDDTASIAKRVRFQAESLHEYITLTTDSLKELEIKNGGRLSFRNSTPNGARGLPSVSHLLFDEAAYVDCIKMIYESSIPCTSMAGDDARIIVNCTPDTMAGWYWDKLIEGNGDKDILKICEDIIAERLPPTYFFTSDNGWCKAVLHWYAHPIYSKKKDTYLEDIQKLTGMTHEAVQREYNLSFTSSEVSVFNPLIVKNNAKGSWEEPENAVYYLGIDTSLLGDDYTVCSVLKSSFIETEAHISTARMALGILPIDPIAGTMLLANKSKQLKPVLKLIKLYRARKKTHEYNIFGISELIDKYNPVAIGIEMNGVGAIYCEKLTNAHTDKEIIPIVTTEMSKHIMINRLQLLMETGKIIYPNDPRIIEELLSFKQVGKKLEAAAGKHDDIVMSLAMGVTVAKIE